MKTFLKNGKGYSLPELLMVVAIAGLIAAMAYPSLQKQIDKKKFDGARKSLVQLADATRAYDQQYSRALTAGNFLRRLNNKGLIRFTGGGNSATRANSDLQELFDYSLAPGSSAAEIYRLTAALTADSTQTITYVVSANGRSDDHFL